MSRRRACGKGGIHTGETGTYNNESHVILSMGLWFSKGW